MLRIGVPEANISSPDLGLPQIERLFNSEGLTQKTEDGRSLPALAESWSSSEDGLTWRFVLRDKVTFHDGTKLTATIAREAMLRALASPGLKALYPGLLDIVDIAADGQRDVVVTLRRRSTYFLDDLDFSITRPNPSGNRVFGTGPFKTVSSSKEEIVMEPHGEYHHGAPQIQQVVIRAYPALRAAWAGMMRQEIDVLWDVAHDSMEFVESGDVAMHSYLRYYQFLIAFNSSRPQLSSAPVRRALNAAIDRAGLIKEVLRGHGLAASGPLWPRHWAYDASLPGYAYDASLARTTLDAAGWRPDARRGTAPARLRFVCLVPQNYAVLERIALYVQKQLYDIGVDMQLEEVSAEEYNRRIPGQDFDAVIIDMISAPVFTRAYQFWRSRAGFSGLNVFGYRNAAADKWFDALREARNDAEYRAATGQLQRVLMEDPPALFLAWNERTRVISRRFDVPVEPGRDPMPNLWKWKLAGDSITH